MSTQSLTWIARRVDADVLAQARTLAAALGLSVVVDEPAKLMVTTGRGDVLEYCGPDADVPPYLFDGDTTVVGFQVDDLETMAAQVSQAGFALHGDPVDGGPVRYVHFRGPGDVTYGLIQPLTVID